MNDFNIIEYPSAYLNFIKHDIPEKKTPIFIINSKRNDEPLGIIKWYGAWRKFCFMPNENTVWDNKCLIDITNFLDSYNKYWKEKDKE